MRNLIDFVNESKTRELRVSINKNGVARIQQTDGNAFKQVLMDSIEKDLLASGLVVGRVAEGIGLEISNDCVADSEAQGSGAITAVIDITIKSLDYDLETEVDAYGEELAEKRAKAKAKADAKAKKIAKDKAKAKSED